MLKQLMLQLQICGFEDKFINYVFNRRNNYLFNPKILYNMSSVTNSYCTIDIFIY